MYVYFLFVVKGHRPLTYHSWVGLSENTRSGKCKESFAYQQGLKNTKNGKCNKLKDCSMTETENTHGSADALMKYIVIVVIYLF